MDEEANPVVIDFGTRSTKVGFGGDDKPRQEFASAVGKPAMGSTSYYGSQVEYYFGDEAIDNRDKCTLQYPFKNSTITNWELMEPLFRHSLNSLDVRFEDSPVLIADSPTRFKEPREKLMNLGFEVFNLPAMAFAYTGVLSLYSSGRTTGITVSAGAGCTVTTPICEGYIISPRGIQRMDISGVEITDRLVEELSRLGYDKSSTSEREDVRMMKEEHCYVALDYEEEMSRCDTNPYDYQKEHRLPDGSSIKISRERFSAPEILFQPKLMDSEKEGVAHMTLKSATYKQSYDFTRYLLSNIVCSGGTSLLPGFSERLSREVTMLAPAKAKIKVNAPAERKHSVWIGGSILASLSTFQQCWTTKEEYDDAGSSIVHRKYSIY